MIAQDGWDLRKLLMELRQHPQSGTLSLSLLPYLSFYVVESSDWLRRAGAVQTSRFSAEQDGRIRSVRARLKLFDTDRGGLDGMTRAFSEIEAHAVKWFNYAHTGLLRRLQLWLQTDLGLSFCGPALIGTSHVGLINTGLDPASFDPSQGDVFAQLGERMLKFSKEIGAYVGALTEALSPIRPLREVRTIDPMSDLKFTAEDYKASTAYGSLREKWGLQGTTYVPAVTWMISQVNFVHLLLPRLLHSDADMLFRARFLTVYHSLSGLRKLSALLRHRPHAALVRVVNNLLAMPAARAIRRQEKLRDAAAHYDVNHARAIPLPASTMRALVPALSRRSLEEVESLLSDCLAQMSTSFVELVSSRSLGASFINRHDYSRKPRRASRLDDV
ncbi:MAG: hypothetical protein R3F14_22195 [Polyangiaceae bacterium]